LSQFKRFSTDDTLVEPSKQQDKVMENPVDDALSSSIKQSEPQSVNVSNALVSQLQRSREQVDFQAEQPIEVKYSLVVSSLLSSFNSLSLF
jgi:hypothetical protein